MAEIPPAPLELTRGSKTITRWFDLVIRAITVSGQIAWDQINQTGSNLADLATKNHNDLDNIGEVDPTDTNTDRDKHVSNRDMKGLTDSVAALQTFSTVETQISSTRFRKRIPVTQTFLETNATAIAHSIVGLNEVLWIVGSINVAGVHYPFPYVTPSQQTSCTVDATNLTSVVAGSPSWTGFTSGFVLLEYSKA